MERDPVDDLLPELAEWAEKHIQDLRGNGDDAAILLTLLNEHVGIADLGSLRPDHLGELLLEHYPREVTVEEDDDLSEVIGTVLDLLAFAVDTGRLSESQSEELRQKAGEIEPVFVDTAMDPANWGTGRQIAQAAAAAGVDLTDEAAVADWLEKFDGELFGESGADLGEQLGLPDRLPPLRLPPDEELAAEARKSTLLDRVRRLAIWSDGRSLDGRALGPADAQAAAGELGLQRPGSVEDITDIPELAKLWDLALDLGFIDAETEVARKGEAVAVWPDGPDETVLDIWAAALGSLMELVFQDDDTYLDLDDATTFAMVSLFLARSEGVPAGELGYVIREAVETPFAEHTDGLDPDDLAAMDAVVDWDSWVEQYGDPAGRLLADLTDLGAALVTEGIARLTPLGQYAFAGALTEGGVAVPVLPPLAETTALDLVDFAKGATDEELVTETEAWFEVRGAAAATDELLLAAAAGGPEDRVLAVAIAGGRAASAPDRWRQALEVPALRPYAKMTLREVGPPDPELESSVTDSAWMLTDMLASAVGTLDFGELPEVLAEVLPAGQGPEIFEAMWRLDHPDVGEVLAAIGAEHPDKNTAKAARKAALKITPKK